MKTIQIFNDQGWVEDKDYPYQLWQRDVAAGNTKCGYLNWLVACHKRDEVGFILDGGPEFESSTEPSFTVSSRFPISDWLIEVENLYTRCGYNTWVCHCVEADEAEEA
jgi:hypothetical protein